MVRATGEFDGSQNITEKTESIPIRASRTARTRDGIIMGVVPSSPLQKDGL